MKQYYLDPDVCSEEESFTKQKLLFSLPRSTCCLYETQRELFLLTQIKLLLTPATSVLNQIFHA